MNYTVKRGKHDFRPWNFPCIYWKPRSFSSFVKFKEGTDFTILPDKDQWDWNKLFGMSFGIRNDYNSIMFGWTYDPTIQKYRVCGYINEKGKFKTTPFVLVDQECHFRAELYKSSVKFLIEDEEFEIQLKFKPKIGRKIGMWFGGNKPSPQDMTIWSTWTVNQ